MFRNHLDMIGRNEPIQRKAKFWQSYVRSLKGTDDMRAPERISTRPQSVFRPFLDYPDSSSSWPYGKSIYDEPVHPIDRIHVPGYRYLPISRETYGISPRPIHPPSVYDRYRSASPSPYRGQDAWDAHQERLAAIDKLLPDKYIPLYAYRPIARSLSPSPRARSASPFRSRSTSPPPPHRSWSPPPSTPSETAQRLSHVGQPIYHRPGWGGYTRRPLSELLDPLPTMPKSFITRDPWWWEYPELRPYTSGYYSWPRSPYYLRNSYLSPIKSTYLWDRHPRRPFGYLSYW